MNYDGRRIAALLLLAGWLGAPGLWAQAPSQPSLRIDRPGGASELICLQTPLSVAVSAGETLFTALALQNDLGCPAGFAAPGGNSATAGDQSGAAASEVPVDPAGESVRAVVASDFHRGGQFPPRLLLNLPGGGQVDRCLAEIPAVLMVADQPTFIVLQALQDDGGCPPPALVTIQSFTLTPDPLDIAASNCQIGGQARTCLTVAWNVSVPAGVTSPGCTVNQTSGGLSMQPAGFTNPSAFTNPGSPGQFIAQMPALLWPLNTAGVTSGLKTFRMTCDPGGQFLDRTVQFNQSNVSIVSFAIAQTSAAQGGMIDYTWQVNVNGAPVAPSCTLRALTSGVLDPITINLPPTPVNQSGSGNAPILPGAPTGNRVFRFECTPGGATADDTVNITPPPVVTISAFNIVPASALPGEVITFDWSVNVENAPPSPSCTLSAVNAGVINPVTINLTPTPPVQSGTSQATLLAGAPTGAQGFTFSCLPGGAVRNDSVDITAAGDNPEVLINSFQVAEASAPQGGQLNFSWNVTLVDNPSPASCVLSADTAGVLVNNVTIGLSATPSVQSGSGTVNLAPGAPTGNQTLRLTCNPGGNFVVDVVDVTSVTAPSVEVNSFNIVETGAGQGGTINYTFSVTLLNNPTGVSCTLTSTTAGVIDAVTIPLPNTPASQSGGGSVQIKPAAPTGVRTFRFECNPGSQFRTDTVNITAPGTLAILDFNVRNVTAPRGSDVIFDFTVQRLNNPVNPSCTLTSPQVINPVTVPVPTGGTTVQNITDQLANILLDAPLGDAAFTLTCNPGGQTAIDNATIEDLPPPGILILDFEILQTNASPGEVLDFTYSVKRIGLPPAPECVVIAFSTIDDLIVPISTAGNATVDGSDTVQIRTDAPPSGQAGTQFTFACRISPSDPFADSQGDVVFVQ